mgnify:CR=1 FL=1|jgi:Predicted transcriptional regulators
MRTHGPAKSATAFRTISEVSTELDVPQHVLRFWETKFPQIRPLKRGGGRRYYRPEDVDLLRQIQSLLYSQGYKIAGVQRLLKEGKPVPADRAEEADLPDDSVDDVELSEDIQEPVGLEEPEEASGTVAVVAAAGALPEAVRREIGTVLDELKALKMLLKPHGSRAIEF